MNLTRLFILLITVVSFSPASAGSLFEDDSIIDIELTGPMGTLIKHKGDREKLPFVLSVNGKDHDILVRSRGKSRLRVCGFPPLKFNFEPDGMEGTVFEGLSGLKLVTHCQNSDTGDENLLEEYAAYRIFNLLSGLSYRVRLLRMTYTNTDGRLSKNARHRYAFAIEPRDELAERVGGTPLHITGVRKSQLNDNQAGMVYVFQFLVGNTDWSFVQAENDDECCHNGDLIGLDEEIVYLPYDFDLAGIVNAKYAKPDSTLRLKSVRHRRYRGYCTDRQTIQKALRFAKAQKAEILGVVQTLPGFTARQTEKAVKYLTGFFEIAENEEELLDLYEKRCIG